MGYFAPTFLAFALNSCGVNIFYENTKPGCEPLVSCLIFLTSILVLLCQLDLYPSRLRRLWTCGAYFMQFLISCWIMEYIMNDFWFPLEASAYSFLPKVAEFEEEILEKSGLKTSGVLRFLKFDASKIFASYALALFFLSAVLHATRALNFRLLQCGPSFFFEDIKCRMTKSFKRLRRNWMPKNTVQFEGENKRASNCFCPIERLFEEDDDILDDYEDDNRHRRYRRR